MSALINPPAPRAAAPTYRGVYINLDRSPGRRSFMEDHAAGLGLSYSRLPAIDGATLPRSNSSLRPNEIGCYLSHLKALDEAAQSDTVTHIIEDDAVLSRRLPEIVATAAGHRVFQHHDIVFGSVLLSPDARTLRPFKLFCDKARNRMATTSPTGSCWPN